MAVPKKRTTKAAKGQRRSHQALAATQLVKAGGMQVPRRLLRAVKLGLIKQTKA